MENSARNAGQGVWQVREVGEKSWNLGNLSKYSGNQEIFLLEKQILQKVSTFRWDSKNWDFERIDFIEKVPKSWSQGKLEKSQGILCLKFFIHPVSIV